MRRVNLMLCGMGGMLLAVGCRAPIRVATQVTEVPRVDLELSGGNRGYLVGTPPEPKPLKTTRQMLETDIEIPSFYKPKPSGVKARLDDGGLLPPGSFDAVVEAVRRLVPESNPILDRFSARRSAAIAQLGANTRRALAFQKETLATALPTRHYHRKVCLIRTRKCNMLAG